MRTMSSASLRHNHVTVIATIIFQDAAPGHAMREHSTIRYEQWRADPVLVSVARSNDLRGMSSDRRNTRISVSATYQRDFRGPRSGNGPQIRASLASSNEDPWRLPSSQVPMILDIPSFLDPKRAKASVLYRTSC